MATGSPTKVKKKKKSVLKRIRQAERRTEFNRANRTQVRTAIKGLRAAISAGDAAKVQQLLPAALSSIDRAIRKGVLKENTANRYKSRLTQAYNAMKAAT